jgi:hypothetical protein
LAGSANPFDAYGDPEDDPEGLQAGPAPSLGESFMANVRGTLATLPSKLPRLYADKKTVDRSENDGVAQPGDSPFAGKVSQQEADQARQRLATARREKETYEAFHSDDIAGKAAGLLGGLGASILDPTVRLSAAGTVIRGISSGARSLGAGSVAANIAGAAAEAGAVNAGIDVASQGLQIASGLQEHYDPLGTVAAFGVGGVLGGGMHGVAEIVSHRVKLRQAETARVDDYMGVRDAQAGEKPIGGVITPGEAPPPVPAGHTRFYHGGEAPTSGGPRWVTPSYEYARNFGGVEKPVSFVDLPNDHPSLVPASEGDPSSGFLHFEAPADVAKNLRPMRRAPEVDAVSEATARVLPAIPDKEFGKIADAAVSVTLPGEMTGRVRVPVSVEEATLLRRSGVDVAEDGSMPAAAVEAIQHERDRRVAVETAANPDAPQAMAASPRQTGPRQDPATASPDRRFPARRELAGEGEKPRTLPADATPDEVAAFRVTDAMRDISARMGRKIEVDGRFSIRGALGEYKPKEGVIRIRQEGDLEVFSHELGHAVDQRLKNAEPTKADWQTIRDANEATLKRLDANETDPAKQTVNEGVAEFLRSYVTNPAYARKQAPEVAEAFERMLVARDPELLSILNDAARVSQIDSGLAPADVMRSMIVSGTKPEGVRKFAQERREMGLPSTLRLWADRGYAAIFGKDHWFKRQVDELRDARFQKTGQPLAEFGWSDPYKKFRMLPGAQQAAIDALYYGVRDYGRALDGGNSPALYDALAKAFGGDVGLINKPDHPMVKSFSAYLVARRGKALYERWRNGDLRNPPVRASENEVLASIGEFETANPAFKEAADDVFSFANAMWRKKFEAGLIPRDVFDTISGRGDDYVPFYRDMRDSKASGGGGGSSAGQERSVVKTMRGSSRDIIDPVHSLAFDTAQTERIIALNDTIKAMHRLAESGGEFSGRFLEKVPNSEMRAQSIDLEAGLRAAAKKAGLEKADAEVMIRHVEEMVGDDLTATVFKATETTARGERLMFYWDAGQRVALKIGDSEISKNFYDLFSGMSAPERDILFATFGKANALFSQLITNAPQFALKNLIMDNVSRVFIARNTGAMGRVPGAAVVQGIYTQIFDREFARSYAAVGGMRGGVASAAARELDEAKGLAALAMKPQGLGAELIHVAKNPLHGIELIVKGIEATETTGRLGQAKIVFKHLKKQGLSDEEAFHAAAYEARDILDYDRKGWGVTAANRFLPFYNAGLQGLDRSGRALFGAPLQVALESYKRGGYANVDEAGKTALADAVKNWGAISAGVALTAGYYAWSADNPVYQRMSDYMRRRYYVFSAGEDKDGKVNVVTVPKPFDHAGGIFGAVEAAMDGIRRADPNTWSRVTNALKDGFVPRQMGGMQEFLNSLPPTIKVPFETLTGMRMGFDNSPAMPIVPQGLKALPPEMQYTGATSYLAKKMGDWFGLSPVVADHVMNGLGGTTVRDVNTLATGLFDDQPNVTTKDAMTKMFFGALYREQRGGGAFRSDLMQIMGRENGEYAVAASGYARAKEEGDSEQASSIYNRGNDLAKTIMTMRSGPFKPYLRQLHPLERTAALGDIFAKVTRDLAGGQVEKLDRSRKRGEERDYIDLEPTTARAINNTLGSLMAEEIRNGLTIAGQPGYEHYDVIDTKARYDAIRALSPEVADEIKKRMDKAHVLPVETVKEAWPELKSRLLKDREQAKVGDLKRSVPAARSAAPRATRKPALESAQPSL